VTIGILGGVALILFANLDLGHSPASGPSSRSGVIEAPKPQPPGKVVAGFREYPIGEQVERDGMRIAAVWLPSVEFEGGGAPVVSGSDVIHLEADIHALAGNPNGFAEDEFVPYLVISYRVVPASRGEPVSEGKLVPMVAKDGLHYGASLSMPRAGSYILTYSIAPPSAGGLGRHHDPVTGVAPWWEPFTVSFEWDYDGPPKG
jgi:uncharacterized protein involved in high-affinity Fe2+ transport